MCLHIWVSCVVKVCRAFAYIELHFQWCQSIRTSRINIYVYNPLPLSQNCFQSDLSKWWDWFLWPFVGIATHEFSENMQITWKIWCAVQVENIPINKSKILFFFVTFDVSSKDKQSNYRQTSAATSNSMNRTKVKKKDQFKIENSKRFVGTALNCSHIEQIDC